MPYKLDWNSVPPRARTRAITGAVNRFRIWQFIRVNGTEFTQREVADALEMHQTTVSQHLASLGIVLEKDRADSMISPCDEFIARPSDGLGLGDVVH